MYEMLQILAVMLVALAMALSIAHALELPGKMRLDRETYFAVQRIYYPGFTIGGGLGEGVGTLLVITLLFLAPSGSRDFWLTLLALLGLVGVHAVYWLVTHPVNRFWIEGENLDRFSAGFFSAGTSKNQAGNDIQPPAWTTLRNRWEYSHVARAMLSSVSFVALLVAVGG